MTTENLYPLGTQQAYEVAMIQGLLKALMARKQVHGCVGLSNEQYTDERQFISQARRFLDEQERVDNLPLTPWDPRWKA